ncbi:aldehyde dehydrogenase family protein [Rhizobium lentis]|uniref:Aldehyde dehydrogenase n=1 Tax=Rhizobium lentis TaxID=1138194 RepID=A0ABS7I9C1_9HYPH|nr:aldehyde dehydrogenase family protein [Rhizobium lentis]MBX5041200.1 aldehyde dehydrogenase [Rhizobium lentis]MBX5051899.1 aldehyde dehydrogenase [Rhizobium lentis]MBX5071457.1 aldehyde dehydrogenase [Rhizobium lentis]MBX5088435.1 aldehyde dehydrogenase [Rhizobium lentis]MBX5108505.1 aldehyde dehydrogenase [Rhizobium lentis]
MSSLFKDKHLQPRKWSTILNGKATDVVTSAATFIVQDPATGEDIAEVQAADAALVDEVVRDARRAYENDWRQRSPRERAQLLQKVAAKIRDHVDELAELEALEVGKPKRDALRFDVSYSHACFDYFAGLADTLHGEILDQGAIEARVLFEPYGVVAAILPFNWPPIHFAKKSAPALAAGNTVVVKPGEQAPLTVMRLVELANEVLPPGVLNVVPGLQAGPALASHPLVERISFTGATATGRRVLQSAAENITYATMELGGKNALMILEDADMQTAINVALEGMFYNQGEACTSTARILVHTSRYKEFEEKFARATEQLVVGDGRDPRTDIGPMVDAKQRARVAGYIDIALKEGARLVTQGKLPVEEKYKNGYWIAPTVLADITPTMTVAQEEIFGPVACLMPFTDEAEAVRIANGTAYGLTAAMVTADESRAWKLAGQLEAGMVFVNNYMRRAFLGSPFGGVKGSGFGRENATETLREFVRSKNVRFPSGKGVIPTWPPKD